MIMRCISGVTGIPLAQSWWCSLVLWVYNRTETAEGAGSEVCTVADTTPIAVDDTNTLVTWYNKGITHMNSHREEKQTNKKTTTQTSITECVYMHKKCS